MTRQSPLNPVWKQWGARFMIEEGWEVPSVITDALGEYRAARTKACLLDLSPRTKLRVTGTDRLDFLHRLLTNDLHALKPGQGCYSFFLTAQGRVITDMRVYVSEEAILLDMEPGFGAKAREHLSRFIIMEDAAIEEITHTKAHLRIRGPEAELFLSVFLALPLGDLRPHDHIIAEKNNIALEVISRRNGTENFFDLITPAEKAVTLTENLLEEGVQCGLQAAGKEAEDILRIEDGILRCGIDFDENIALPETGLERTGASPTKGCYPGQEVVARMETYQGHTKKAVGLIFEGETVPSAGDKIFVEGKEAGWITSACLSPAFDHPIALGYLKKPYFARPVPATIESSKGSLRAQSLSLPFKPSLPPS